MDYNDSKYGAEIQRYFITDDYIFDINENFKFKPFAMVKSAFNAIVSMDLSTNFLINEKFEIGTTNRLEDSFGTMVNYAFSKSIKIGYAYDHIVSDLKATTLSSHRLILLFDVNFTKKTYQSPKFF